MTGKKAAPRGILRRFWREEDGSMVVFSLFLILAMLIVAGVAVDVMRHESNRTRLMATADRCALAASDLEQVYTSNWTVDDLVLDCFTKAGLAKEFIDAVPVENTLNSRMVTVEAGKTIPTYFMRWVGVKELSVPASSTARESVSDIEIALVLDVSGSMVRDAQGNPVQKLANLKTAAKNFVQRMLEDDDENRISIAMVPFNGQVNLGPVTGSDGKLTLASWYSGITERVPSLYTGSTYTHIGCVDLPSGVYSAQTIARTLGMPATAMADTFSTTAIGSDTYRHYSTSWNGGTYGLPNDTNMWCPRDEYSNRTTAGNVVRLPSHSISGLQTSIDALEGVGATSINAGMRWGMTLIEPGARPLFNDMITAGRIPEAFRGRPYDFNREDTLKVIVLMTDGSNWAEERVNDGFRSGPSPIWRQNTNERYFSIFHNSKVNRTGTGTTLSTNIANSRPFWVPHLGQWHARPWNGTVPDSSVPYVDNETKRRLDINGDGACNNNDDGRGTLKADEICWGRVTRQTWPDVWTALRMQWVAFQLYGRAGVASNNVTGGMSATTTRQMDLFRTQTPIATMDSQLDQMCDLARDKKIVVYGIAFEAPAEGAAVISACATSPSRYYYTTTGTIGSTFDEIASDINALRLMQ